MQRQSRAGGRPGGGAGLHPAAPGRPGAARPDGAEAVTPSPERQPGSPTAFEDVVDHYDAARPSYPPSLYDALPGLAGTVLELGAGTGIATRELESRAGSLVATDLASASKEVARVLRPGGALALWWNEVAVEGLPWWDAQQDRLEGENPRYSRRYRARDYGAELAPCFAATELWTGRWERTLDWPTYERWLRSKSYVQALDDVEAFVAAEQQSLADAFPSGRIVEPFVVSLWIARTT